MSAAAANKKNSSKTKSTNPQVYSEAFLSWGINRFTFEVGAFVFGAMRLCRCPDVEVITLRASLEELSSVTLFSVTVGLIKYDRPEIVR